MKKKVLVSFADRFMAPKFNIKNLLIETAVSVAIGQAIVLSVYREVYNSSETLIFVVLYSISIGVPLFNLSRLLNRKLENYVQWLKWPLRRFLLTIFAESFLGIIHVFVINLLFFTLIFGASLSEIYERTSNAFLYIIILTVFGVILKNTFYFFRNWRQLAVNEEILKREQLMTEYNALKNQINPHFLFNNLTALNSLIMSDKQKALQFVEELSGIFRYVLEMKDKDVVPIHSEIEFIQSIKFLYKIRHGDALQINIDIPNKADFYIIPMALQMLIENAIKHNVASDEKPLIVRLFKHEKHLIVSNNLQQKTAHIVSNKIGLENIRKRYELLCRKKMIVEKTQNEFIVKLPVLENYD